MASKPSESSLAKAHSTKSHLKQMRLSNQSYIPVKHPLDDLYFKNIKISLKKFGEYSDLIFMGDTAIYRFCKTTHIWKTLEQKYAAVSISAPNLNSEHLLHHLVTSSMLSNINNTHPTIFLMAGMSNILAGDTTKMTFDGVVAVINGLFSKWPVSTVYVLSLLPHPVLSVNETASAVNILLSQQYPLISSPSTNSAEKRVSFLDVSGAFVRSDHKNFTRIVRKNMFVRDDLGLSPKGSDQLLTLIQPYLDGVPVITHLLPLSLVTVNGTEGAKVSKKPKRRVMNTKLER
jgi:hypothetical protein